ncbi:MAG: undecaprenyldiphospho-muramoylpentapeptide beta-N-acetylglucosaminyltransferase [Streptosporangiales bacterium]|nr:undecaprenyldiphospho-muramoylpentapeptide beta-N-acetylglucosaminyltransferase [Streptosporangiales bacterium]
MTLRVVLAGGGTAGHIEPALNLADALRAADPTVQITALGTERGLETMLVPKRGYELELIPPVPLPRRPSPQLVSLPVRVAKAVSAAAKILDAKQADVLVGFGGYVALPAYLAARRRKVPIVVHEANPLPGLANRVGAGFTPYVAITVPGTKLPHATLTGVPLREAILQLDRPSSQRQARAEFGLEPDRPTLLVFGGSQGARSVNAAVRSAAERITAAGIQVLHAVGPKNTVDVDLPDGSPPYVTCSYVERMDLAYAAADLALCRAGMMTCGELAAVGLPAVYVPLPIGNGEQRRNAMPIVDAGGGLLVDDGDLDAGWIEENVLPLLTDAPRLAAMADAAKTVGRPDAGQELRELVLRAVRESGKGSAANDDGQEAE